MTEEAPPPIVLRRRRATPSDVRWAQRVEDLEFDALSNVRSTAEKWAATLAAIIGLGGTIIFVKGRDDVSRLTTGYQLVIAVVIFAALVTALVATVFAALAAQGTPREVAWPSPGELRKWQRDEARKAIGHLRTSRILAVVVVALLAIAVGLTWFGAAKPASPAPATVLVVRKVGTPLCGRVVDSGGGAVSLIPQNSPAVMLDGADIQSLVLISSCPANTH